MVFLIVSLNSSVFSCMIIVVMLNQGRYALNFPPKYPYRNFIITDEITNHFLDHKESLVSTKKSLDTLRGFLIRAGLGKVLQSKRHIRMISVLSRAGALYWKTDGSIELNMVVNPSFYSHILLHEFGHVWWMEVASSRRRAIFKDGIRDNPTEYSNHSSGESFCECFRDYCVGTLDEHTTNLLERVLFCEINRRPNKCNFNDGDIYRIILRNLVYEIRQVRIRYRYLFNAEKRDSKNKNILDWTWKGLGKKKISLRFFCRPDSAKLDSYLITLSELSGVGGLNAVLYNKSVQLTSSVDRKVRDALGYVFSFVDEALLR